jgi:hypothetical protein
LIENASPGDTVASFEIGFIGYFTGLRVIDLAGLVTPELLPWVDDGIEETLKHSLRLFSPDFVLIPYNNGSHNGYLISDVRYKLVKIIENRYILFRKISDY